MSDEPATSTMLNSKGEFALEPDVEPGTVPTGVIDELRHLRTSANEAAVDFRDAIKVQAEKYRIKPAALRRYVIALASDKLDATAAETADLERLLERADA